MAGLKHPFALVRPMFRIEVSLHRLANLGWTIQHPSATGWNASMTVQGNSSCIDCARCWWFWLGFLRCWRVDPSSGEQRVGLWAAALDCVGQARNAAPLNFWRTSRRALA
jgi:hypothetical protein